MEERKNNSENFLTNDNMLASVVPQENIEAYCFLYVLETSLRELIVEKLSEKFGPFWYKSRLPNDILSKYEEGRKKEKDIRWTQMVAHHPIYYIDFTDLKKIIEENKNWEEVFKHVFKRKEIFGGTLTEIEPVRNKVAHNRKLTKEDVSIIKAAFTKISETIGKDKFYELSSKCTSSHTIFEQIADLKNKADEIFNLCKEYKLICSLDTYNSIINEWWFDETYLGCSIDSIREFFKIMNSYSTLPRERGKGHKIEHWVKENDIENKYKNAMKEFACLLEKGGAK